MKSSDPTQLLKPWGSGVWGWRRAATTVSWAPHCLNHHSTFRLVPNEAGTRCLLSSCNLPDAGHLGYSPSPGLVTTLEKMSLGWRVPTHEAMHSGEHQERCYIWRPGLWHHFLMTGAHPVYGLSPHPQPHSPSPSSYSDCVGHRWMTASQSQA